jgi:hypothetical protein
MQHHLSIHVSDTDSHNQAKNFCLNRWQPVEKTGADVRSSEFSLVSEEI